MESATTKPEVQTFHGRSLEEILPKVREALGPDAIVLRRREGLKGGVGGFFQKAHIEVDARAALPGEGEPAEPAESEFGDSRIPGPGQLTEDTVDLSSGFRATTAPATPSAPIFARNDRATEEGLGTPAVQTLVDQASPFAAELSRVSGGTVGDRAAEILLAAAETVDGPYGRTDVADPAPAPGYESAFVADAMPEPIRAAAAGAPPAPAYTPAAQAAQAQAQRAPMPVAAEPELPAVGLYGPQPNAAQIAGIVEAPAAPVAAAPVVAAPALAPAPVEPAAVAAAQPFPAAPALDGPGAADARERLVASGLSETLATEIVAEAVVHGLPFGSTRALDGLVRATIARRISVLAGLGTGPRRIAFAGAGGAGKTHAIAHLAAAYAQAGVRVAVVALRAADGGAALAMRLMPLGVQVITAADAAQAAERLGAYAPTMLLVDAPAAGPGDADAVSALAAELQGLGIAEVHLALPATISAAAAGELADALAPLAPTHVALTHADQTARPGAAVEAAMARGLAVSYLCTRQGTRPADAGDLARRLLP